MIPNQGFNHNNNNNNLGMNFNDNSLYMQKFQQTFINMQENPNIKISETNLNNMNNILSLINSPVLVPYHTDHPLINCKTIGRDLPKHNWRCNICSKDYSYDVPTFYCTNCDFDLCQKCFLSLYAYQIVVYKYNDNEIPVNKNNNPNFYKPAAHNHPLVKILKDESYYVSDYKCNFCSKEILKKDAFYFCSICNYCLCQICYDVKLQPPGTKLCNDSSYLGNTKKSH